MVVLKPLEYTPSGVIYPLGQEGWAGSSVRSLANSPKNICSFIAHKCGFFYNLQRKKKPSPPPSLAILEPTLLNPHTFVISAQEKDDIGT
jgi:hypothetical protein